MSSQDKRPERKAAGEVNKKWQHTLGEGGIDRDRRKIEMNMNYKAHIGMDAALIKGRKITENHDEWLDARDCMTTEELLREMRLEEAQIDNIDFDVSEFENITNLENTRQDTDSWY